jgi:transposase
MEIIALDSHKRYSQVCVQDAHGRFLCEKRIEHEKGNIHRFLSHWTDGSAVAVETIGNWYWIVDEIEAAGMIPKLVHAHKAKLMLGAVNKTDKLDARGMNTLQFAGTLPTVWIPPGELRDQRELPRTRMVFGNLRTRLKNRIHSVIDKYGWHTDFARCSDIFGSQGRKQMALTIKKLPPQTSYTLRGLLRELDQVEKQIQRLEKRMKKVFLPTPEIRWLMSLPGIGFILAVVIYVEVGEIARFSRAERLVNYAGMAPRVHSSGGKSRYGPLRNDVNHYLKWAFAEAGNSVAVNHTRLPHRHVSQLYQRIRVKKGHAKAVGAVGRHLAEASYWVLTKQQTYQEPNVSSVSSTVATARCLS